LLSGLALFKRTGFEFQRNVGLTLHRVSFHGFWSCLQGSYRLTRRWFGVDFFARFWRISCCAVLPSHTGVWSALPCRSIICMVLTKIILHYGAFVIEFTNPAGEYGVWVSFSIEKVDFKSGYGVVTPLAINKRCICCMCGHMTQVRRRSSVY